MKTERPVPWLSRSLAPVRLFALTLLTGGLMGAASAIFLAALAWVSGFRERTPWLVCLLPAVGILTAWIYQRYGKGAHRGNNLVIDSVHQESPVPFRMAGLTFGFTILTHLAGGSAGREGTAVQIGGAISYRIGQLFKLARTEQRVLVMAGISAGFGSVFGTPLAGAFFGLEMCFVGKLSYEALLPCFLASFTAHAAASWLGAVHPERGILAVPAIRPPILALTFLAAVLFGLCGKYFAIAVHRLKRFYADRLKNGLWRAGLTSTLVLAVLLLTQGFRYSGLSTWMIDAAFAGQAKILDPILKFILTVLTLSAGFQGGEATPLFDIGASLGGLIGQAAHVEPSLFAALGLISVFGCAANVPITTIILGIELFGTAALPYYILTALVSYYVTGHHGIYSAQRIHTVKRLHLKSHAGQKIEAIHRPKG